MLYMCHSVTSHYHILNTEGKENLQLILFVWSNDRLIDKENIYIREK